MYQSFTSSLLILATVAMALLLSGCISRTPVDIQDDIEMPATSVEGIDVQTESDGEHGDTTEVSNGYSESSSDLSLYASTLLASPLGITSALDGSIYIVDAGSPSEPYSGRVLRVDPNGKTEIIKAGFSNFLFPEGEREDINGLSSVLVEDATIYVTIGVDVWLDEPLFGPNRVLEWNMANGEFRTAFSVASLWESVGRDESPASTNLFDLSRGSDGSLWIVDAGGNWVFRQPPDGTIGPIVRFPDVDGEEAVPTSVAVDDDGNAYVTLFRCQQPTAGKGGIARVAPDGDFEIVIDGLSNPIAVEYHDGELYVLEFSQDFRPDSGRLLRITVDGEVIPVIDQLNFPTDLAISGDSVYFTLMPGTNGGEFGEGSLVRADLGDMSQ